MARRPRCAGSTVPQLSPTLSHPSPTARSMCKEATLEVDPELQLCQPAAVGVTTRKSSQLRPQTSGSKDKPSPLCRIQIPDPQIWEPNEMVANATKLESNLELSYRKLKHALSAGATATQLPMQWAPRLAKNSDLFFQNNWKMQIFFSDFEMFVNISKSVLKYSAGKPNPTRTSPLARESLASTCIWDDNRVLEV